MDLDSYVAGAADELAAPGGWGAREWLQDRGLKPETIARARLGWDPNRRAVVIPYLNPTGTVRIYRYRYFQGDIKYQTPKGFNQHLYNVVSTKEPRVWICEGEMDALTLCQLGLDAVGVPGVASFKPEWRYLFAYADEVSIVFDGDEPGKEGASKIARILSPLVPRLRLIRMPDGKDVNDLYKEDLAKLEELVR